MSQAMRGVTQAMKNMSRQMNLPQIQKIMMEFERQTEIMDMKEEMMGEAIDDAIADEGDEEETDAVVSQVFDIYFYTLVLIQNDIRMHNYRNVTNFMEIFHTLDCIELVNKKISYHMKKHYIKKPPLKF